MSINKVLSFLKRQGVLTISKNKRIDTELATSYLSLFYLNQTDIQINM